MMQTGPGPSRLPLRFRLPHAGQRCQQEWRVAVEAAVGFRKPRQQTVGQWPAVGYLSASRIGRSALYLRTIRPGDRFTPMGMQGSRKVQDILTDLKVPRHQRAGTVVVECRNELVWLPGYGISRDWAVANRKAASLRIRIQRAKGA
jgi:tRNA(Ile)-lysidine synthase